MPKPALMSATLSVLPLHLEATASVAPSEPALMSATVSVLPLHLEAMARVLS